jgi:hypothetical protein
MVPLGVAIGSLPGRRRPWPRATWRQRFEHVSASRRAAGIGPEHQSHTRRGPPRRDASLGDAHDASALDPHDASPTDASHAAGSDGIPGIMPWPGARSAPSRGASRARRGFGRHACPGQRCAVRRAAAPDGGPLRLVLEVAFSGRGADLARRGQRPAVRAEPAGQPPAQPSGRVVHVAAVAVLAAAGRVVDRGEHLGWRPSGREQRAAQMPDHRGGQPRQLSIPAAGAGTRPISAAADPVRKAPGLRAEAGQRLDVRGELFQQRRRGRAVCAPGTRRRALERPVTVRKLNSAACRDWLFRCPPEGLQPRPQPGADLGFPVPPVTPECADGGQLAVSRPPGDGLRVDSEHRRDFSWCEQRLAVRAHISCPLRMWVL